MLRGAALIATLGIVLVAGACASNPPAPPAERVCGLVVWHKPASREAHVEIVGDWNEWKRPGVFPEEREDGWRVAAIDVAPGEHAYAIVQDGVWLTDKNQPMTGFHDGRDVTVAVAADCGVPELRVERVETAIDASGQGRATVRARFFAARGGSAVDPASVAARAREGAPPLRVLSVDAHDGSVVLEATGLPRGKATYTLSARDADGRSAEEARAVVWIDQFSGKEPFDPRDAIVYQVLLDRFRGDDGPLPTPATPSARAGGTLAGVRKALESGEIEALGANTLWLSPLYENPTGEYPGNDGRSYSSYHGYWPIDSRKLDARVASEAELDAFMSAAHARGVRVLFDVVPNHVHEKHPWASAHPDWFVKGCTCGQGACDWATHIKTCWFASYLPDLDWSKPEVGRAVTDDVLWWFDRWDADGIRIDAVPMMPRAATRRIATYVRRKYEHPGHTPYVLGENFTGPGGYSILRYDLGPFGLDGSFHFPLMWTLREAIAAGSAPLSEIDASFRAGEAAWEGSGAVMGLMIGNHDVSRFASVSAGNASGDAWAGPPQPLDPLVYAKQRLALAAVLTLPGAPVLYYGDEVGLAGRGDPDCRRVMPAEDQLLASQIETRDLARKVGRARACSRALRRGELRTLLADAERFVFARETDSGEMAIVALTRKPNVAVDVPLPAGAPAVLVDAVSGARVEVASAVASEGGPTLRVEPDAYGVRVYVAPDGGCAAP